MTPTFEQFRQLRAKGKISMGIDQSTALRVIPYLPARYQAAHNFWSAVWMLSIVGFIIGAFFTYGLTLLGLVFVSPLISGAIKESAAGFVMEEASRNKILYDALIQKQAIEFQWKQ